jgi:hypothetical protein
MALKVFSRHRLLDPLQIVRREPRDAPAGLRGIERLVEIQHQRDVGTDQGAHRFHHALVIGEIAVAAFDLDAAKTLIERTTQILFVGDGIDGAVTVIGPDRPRRPTQQRHQRLTGRLAERVPEGHVEAGYRHADQTLPAEQPEFGIHGSHQVKRRDRLAGQITADLFDQLHQRPKCQPGVGKDIGVSGNALIGRDIDQHQGCCLDDAERVFHGPRDRRDHRPGFDAANG